jgi:hypothetical protein
MGSITMIDEKREELRRLEAVESKVSRWTKSEGRLKAAVQALRMGSMPNQSSESVPSFSANLNELRTAFWADIAAASEKLETEIVMLKSWARSYVRYCDSLVFDDFPAIFEDFKGQKFTLLWRGTRDGFGADDFHSRCDGHPNTLTVILDTDGNIFGGFTPLKWESRMPKSLIDWNNCYKADPSLKSFLFTLKNPQKSPARRFALKTEKKLTAMCCVSDFGPEFCDIVAADTCTANTANSIDFGNHSRNDIGVTGRAISWR